MQFLHDHPITILILSVAALVAISPWVLSRWTQAVQKKLQAAAKRLAQARARLLERLTPEQTTLFFALEEAWFRPNMVERSLAVDRFVNATSHRADLFQPWADVLDELARVRRDFRPPQWLEILEQARKQPQQAT